MNSMSGCEACEQYECVETESVGAADNLRFARAVLAAVNGAPDAVVLITEQVKGCSACTTRMLGAGIAMCAGQMQMIGMMVAAAERPADSPPTWAEANQRTVEVTQQMVLDAQDLESGLPEA